jgi:hypothetical protein
MKGQSSVEFMVYIGILLVILSVFLWSSNSLQSRLNDVKIQNEAQQVCDKVAFEINTAVRSGNGYKRGFFMEKNFFGVSDFEINIDDYTVYLTWNNFSVISNIITKNITGTITQGRINTIENRGGIIYVN